MGNQSAGVRDAAPLAMARAEFVGRPIPQLRIKADAGDVLALIDVASHRAGLVFLSGEKNLTTHTTIENRPDDAVSLVTMAFNSFVFTKPIYEGDLVMFTSLVVSASKSTVGLHVLVERQGYESRTPEMIGESFVTFVAIQGKNLNSKSSGLVPAVRLNSPEEVRLYEKYNTLRTHKRLSTPPSPLTVEAVELECNRHKKTKMTISETTTVANRTFFRADMNVNNVIFGGKVLQFLEQAALHCGRVFAGTPHIHTVAMLGMTFDGPVRLEDESESTCRVVCVRNSTMLVTVRVAATNGPTSRKTNAASFILMATDDKGSLIDVPNGIDLGNATPEELLEYWQGRCMMEESIKARRNKQGAN
ncbi:ATP-binding protein Cassette (ABC) superfamily [Angomonas deanei]|uniref:Thioesterase superfamily, putative n=1 Tax=Angomonas deanei TaxID=59799 RepID=A0A7G2CI06_9TRYP|nr:ATP-binding protein Cassette (ABC) superfamily [Angomonas deanei]CAD2218554.1 Thioesterase superfamily, putative [Angomonas deanei]|eukprot:EPY36529.1 ATP-binding protein Cassette (ABC) superfamily [Angomonas deanei]